MVNPLDLLRNLTLTFRQQHRLHYKDVKVTVSPSLEKQLTAARQRWYSEHGHRLSLVERTFRLWGVPVEVNDEFIGDSYRIEKRGE